MSSWDAREGRIRSEDKRRRRDRDRGDRDFDRRMDRDGDRDTEGRHQSCNPISGPIVLLKRPGAPVASSSQPQLSSQQQLQTSSKDKDGNVEGDTTKNDEVVLQGQSSKPMILQRSKLSKRNADSSHDIRGSTPQQDIPSEKPKPMGLLDILKPVYKFPFENAVTLIDKNMKIKPLGDFDFFSNGKTNLDFFVVTVVGKPLTGKSAILSHLISGKEFGSSKIFEKRNRNQEMESSMYITSDHIIFIEMASLFNCAAAHDLITSAPQQGTLETTALTWNLRLMRWALAVSHVVLIVSDSLIDPNLFQLINSAEMIHSMESSIGEGIYPELLFVCNKAPLSYLDNLKMIAQFQFMFSTLTGREPRIHPNFYILPHTKWDSDFHRFENLRKKIYNFNRYNRAPFAPEIENVPKIPQKYSVYEWYSNATKLWEEMNHSNYFTPYVKLLPMNKYIGIALIVTVIAIIYPSNTSKFVSRSYGFMQRSFGILFDIIFVSILIYYIIRISISIKELYYGYFSTGNYINVPAFPSVSTIVTESGDHREEFFDIPEILVPVDDINPLTRRRRRQRMASTLLQCSNRDESRSARRDAIRKSLHEVEEIEFLTPPPSPRPTHLKSHSQPLLRSPIIDNETVLNTSFQEDESTLGKDEYSISEFLDKKDNTSVIIFHSPVTAGENTKDTLPNIVIHQFPRAISKPCLSCDGMYLETYVRLIGIPCTFAFDCLDNSGPWITFNLKNVYGANNCMELLKELYPEITSLFTVDGERRISSWCTALLIDHLNWGLKCWRWLIENAQEFKSNQPGWSHICKNLSDSMKSVRATLWTMGFGKLSCQEVHDVVIRDLEALSCSLGTKSFLLGETPTEIDCLAFSVLCQILWGPESILREKLREFYDIHQYCVRIRNMLWPDWDKQLAGNLHVKSTAVLKIDAADMAYEEELKVVSSYSSAYEAKIPEKIHFTKLYYQLVHPDEDEVDNDDDKNSNCVSNEEHIFISSRCTSKLEGTKMTTNQKLYQHQQLEIQDKKSIRILQDKIQTSGVEEYFDDNFEDMEIIS